MLICSKIIRSSSRKYDGYRVVTLQICAATQLATPLGKKKHMMDDADASNLNPDNIIPITLDDLSEDERRELERELEEQKAEALKLKLRGYLKTRSGVIVKKVTAPIPSPALDSKVSEEIAHQVDVSVASKVSTV